MGEAISPFSRGQKQITEVKKVTNEMLKFAEMHNHIHTYVKYKTIFKSTLKFFLFYLGGKGRWEAL